MKKIKAVVIDDEKSNRELIVKLISDLNQNFEILGEADSVKSGSELIHNIEPEVVFLDIKMPDGSGFDLLHLVEKINFEVVFISGFDSYALKAFEFNALDYVLKPVEPEKFAKVLNKVQSSIDNKSISPVELKSILQSYDLNKLIISKIPIHVGTNVVFINIKDLLFIKSDEGCTIFKTTANEKYISSKQLSDFEFILEYHLYLVRINKGTYVNINFISNYSKGTSCFLTLNDGTVFEISRRRKAEILVLLAGKKIKQ